MGYSRSEHRLIRLALLDGADRGELMTAAVVGKPFAIGFGVTPREVERGERADREIEAARHPLRIEFIAAHLRAFGRVAETHVPVSAGNRSAGIQRDFTGVVGAAHGIYRCVALRRGGM